MASRVEEPPAAASLLRRIREGDAAAEEELVARFERRVHLIALARIGDPEAARDLAQESLLGVLTALRAGRLEDEERLVAYLHGTVRNLCNNFLRARRRRPQLVALPELSGDEDPEADCTQAERREIVRRALVGLPASEREVLLLTLVEGLKPREIAARLGLGLEVVRQRKSRALRKVRSRVRRFSRPGISNHTVGGSE
jgi:RNA polymerase sigma factor (sigma-70 family)